ncbi:thiamine pyrophosphate-binding protein [Streptosporangium sp. NPDC051022]|uniref:thiamine pyrophosphate-binding protein n=1 Tax=Streptosporangium sp. NPDC051022 TaxID=3155752 RepID=UPI0034249453
MTAPVSGGRARYEHDEAVVEVLYSALRRAGIGFAASVPDTLNYPLVRRFEADPEVISISCAREDEAVAAAMGAFLGGAWPCVMMEGSGIGLSALALARAIAQRTPMLILASHLRALGERHDYHAATRLVTEPVLAALQIPIVPVIDPRDIPMFVREAQMTVQGDRRPVALVFPRHSLHVQQEEE